MTTATTADDNQINVIIETKWCVCGHHYDDHYTDGWQGKNRKLRPCVFGCGFPKGCCRISVNCPCIEFVATKVTVPYVDEKTREKYQDVSSNTADDNDIASVFASRMELQSKLRINPQPPSTKDQEVEKYYPSKPVQGCLLPWVLDFYIGKLDPKFTAYSYAADAKYINPAEKLKEIDKELEDIRKRAANKSKPLVDRIISGEDRNLV